MENRVDVAVAVGPHYPDAPAFCVGSGHLELRGGGRPTLPG
jgi:hypothetical protein